MGRRARYHGGVGERGLGMELRVLRKNSGISLEKLGEVIGWSANTISRLERGLRPDTMAEEVSALLAAMGVMGEDRERIMRMARGYRDQGWWEDNSDQLTDQARTYLKFERRATKIIDVEPLLVPGLLQTPDYYRALLKARGIPDDEVETKIARRLGRQAILSRPQPPDLVFVVSELMLRQPLGGHSVMARQVRRLRDEADRGHTSVKVIPINQVVHLALHGAFVVLKFSDEPAVVYIEGWMSGLFPENPKEISAYMLTAERLTSLALDKQRSIDLLHSIAKDLERAS
jgi:transcriptional regulator with XRE-family HTH domain